MDAELRDAVLKVAGALKKELDAVLKEEMSDSEHWQIERARAKVGLMLQGLIYRARSEAKEVYDGESV